MKPARGLRSAGPRTAKRLDFRLLYVLLVGSSGVILMFRYVISTSVIEAVVVSAWALAICLLIASRALRPWRGSDRGKVAVLSFSVAQLIAVLVVAAVVK